MKNTKSKKGNNFFIFPLTYLQLEKNQLLSLLIMIIK